MEYLPYVPAAGFAAKSEQIFPPAPHTLPKIVPNLVWSAPDRTTQVRDLTMQAHVATLGVGGSGVASACQADTIGGQL